MVKLFMEERGNRVVNNKYSCISNVNINNLYSESFVFYF